MLPSLPPPPHVVSVCVFSGLPLFTPYAEAASFSAADPPLSSSDASSSSSAWVDGIIRDLISNAPPEVSVPQLIHNVREIIQPCNPLASLLENCLCLLSDILPSVAADALPLEPSHKQRRDRD